jgi:WD40 repeat protein
VQHEDWTMEIGGSGFGGPEWAALFREAGGRMPFAPASIRPGHEGTVTRAAFLPDGDRFVTASWDDYRLCLWSSDQDAPLSAVTCERRPHDLTVLPDGSGVAVVDAYGNLTVWPVEYDGFGEPRILMGDAGKSPRVAVSADGRWFATTGYGYAAAVWDVAQGRKVRELPDSESLRGVAFSPAGPVVVCGTQKNELILWDLDARAMGRKRLKIPKVTPDSDVWAVAWDPQGHYLATGHMDASVTVWDAERRKPLHDSYIQDASTFDVEFSPDGTILATAHQNGQVHFWDPESGRPVGRVDAHQGGATAVAFRQDGLPAFVTGGEDGNVILWQ